MSLTSLGVNALGTAFGGYMSYKAAQESADAKKRMAKSYDRMAEVGQEQVGLGEDYLDFGRDQFDFFKSRWKEQEERYGGLRDQVVAEAERGAQADIAGVSGRAASDVQQSMDQEREQQRRQMAAYGLDPTSGRYQSQDRQFGLQAATAEASAVGQARRGERQRAQERTDQLRGRALQQGNQQAQRAQSGMRIGQGIMGQGANIQQAGLGTVAKSHGQRAQTHGDFAHGYSRQSGQFAGMAFDQASQGIQEMGDMWGNNTPGSYSGASRGHGLNQGTGYSLGFNQNRIPSSGLNTNERTWNMGSGGDLRYSPGSKNRRNQYA